MREIYTRLAPFERMMLRRMVRERRIRLLDIGILPIEIVHEEVQEYVREQLRKMRWRRRMGAP